MTLQNARRALLAYLAAVLVCFGVAILLATTANFINLAGIGVKFGLGDIVYTYLFDLWGMTPRWELARYGNVMLIAFAIAFPVAALLRFAALRIGGGARRLAHRTRGKTLAARRCRPQGRADRERPADVRQTTGRIVRCRARSAVLGQLSRLSVARARRAEAQHHSRHPRAAGGRGRISPFETYPGVTEPLLWWTPSIGAGGVTVYPGMLFPEWDGDLLAGAMGHQHLQRIEMDGGKVVARHRLLEDRRRGSGS